MNCSTITQVKTESSRCSDLERYHLSPSVDTDRQSITDNDTQSECSNPIEAVLIPNNLKIRKQSCEKFCYYRIQKKDFIASVIPNYFNVAQGMNFEVICHKSGCKIYNENVFVQLGMCRESNQICHYAEYMFEVLCPSCCQQIEPENIKRILFVNCTVKIKFKRSDDISSKELELASTYNEYICIRVIKERVNFNYFKITLS